MNQTSTFHFGNSIGNFFGGFDTMNIAMLFPFIAIVITVIINIAMAIGTHVDAKYMYHNKRGPFLVAPFIWALAVLVGGIPVVVAYWAIHHSTLRPRSSSESAPLE